MMSRGAAAAAAAAKSKAGKGKGPNTRNDSASSTKLYKLYTRTAMLLVMVMSAVQIGVPVFDWHTLQQPLKAAAAAAAVVADCNSDKNNNDNQDKLLAESARQLDQEPVTAAPVSAAPVSAAPITAPPITAPPITTPPVQVQVLVATAVPVTAIAVPAPAPAPALAPALGPLKFVVWMFPHPPPPAASSLSSKHTAVQPGETLVCAYSNACDTTGSSNTRINLRTLTEGTFYENYIRDHAWHKIRHRRDFPAHVQVIVLLGLLQKHPKSCVRTLGSARTICQDDEYFQKQLKPDYHPYDPYSEPDQPEWNFPLHNTTLPASPTYFPIDLLVESDGTSMVPTDALEAEQFMIYGIYPQDEGKVVGYYNTGNDVQWLASAHWLPYITDVKPWKDGLQHYKGYIIGNSLLNLFTSPDKLELESLRKVSFTSIFTPMELVKKNWPFFHMYTTQVQPFGARSTVTHTEMLDLKLPTYFSACLTLTIDMQGGTIVNPNNYVPKHNAADVVKPQALAVDGTSVISSTSSQRTQIFMVDVIDASMIPTAIQQSATILNANVPNGFPIDPHAHRQLIGYAYKLVSQYARNGAVMITSRIHVGLPCMAMGIPVLFVNSASGHLPGGHHRTGRVSGLTELFTNIDANLGWPAEWGTTPESFLAAVPPNPGNHEADRYRASHYSRLKRESHYYADTVRTFGMVPYQRLGLSNGPQTDRHSVFHFAIAAEEFTTEWLTRRAVELVLYFHPNAKVILHSHDLSNNDPAVELFVDSGYNLVVVPYSINDVDSDTKESRTSMMRAYGGGVFISKTTFLTKPISVDMTPGVLLDGAGKISLIIYGDEIQLQAEPSWISHVISLTEKSTVGCMTEALGELPSTTAGLLGSAMDKNGTLVDDTLLALSLDATALAGQPMTKLNSPCYWLLERKCIYCDEVHVEFEPGDVTATSAFKRG